MRIDRAALKYESKRWMERALPRVWLVTLVFLLATNGLSEVLQLFCPNPLVEIEESLMEAYQSGDYFELERAVYAALPVLQSMEGTLGMFLGFLLGLYSTVVGYGYRSYSLAVVRGEASGYGEMFSRFYLAGKIILLEFACAIFVSLWSMLFVFPGLIAAYRYRMAPYLLLDDPDLPVLEAIRRSKALMRGRKWELFVLDLSFLPWTLGVSAIASGVQMASYLVGGTVAAVLAGAVAATACNLFLIPYQSFTEAGWYQAVCAPQRGPEEPWGQA